MKHTINGSRCVYCGKGMRPTKPSRKKTSTNLCFTCVNDRESLPEKYFCEATTKSTGKKCRKITIDKYCAQHKNRDENNEKQINDKQNNQDVR